MSTTLEDLSRVVLISIGATAAVDLWLLLLKRMNVQTLNFALVGLWVGAWLTAWLIAFPIAPFATPLARRFVKRFVRWSDPGA